MKFLKYIAFSGLLAIGFYSCEDFVDIEPTDIIVGDASSINSLEAARDLVNGSYGFINNPVSFGDIGSDNTQLAPTNTGQGVFTHNWQYSETNPQDNWVGQYNMLSNVNTLLAVIDNIEAPAADEPVRAQIKAEGLALRAMAHYTLYRYYSPGYDPSSPLGVVVQTQPIEAGQLPARNTVGDVINQIETDLTDAFNLFPSDGITQLDFFSKASVAALMARVQLDKGAWGAAADWAQDAIDLSGKSVATRTEYPLVWRDNSTAGVIMSSLRTPTGYMAAFNRITNEDIFYYGATGLYDLYDDDDIRKSFNFEDDGTGLLITKWPANQSSPAIDVKLFRVGEMHLIKAEALARDNDIDGADDEINALRSNRISGYTPITYATQSEAIDDIIQERRLELAYEGIRMFDLKRLGMGVDRAADDCITAQCTLSAGADQFSLPIPNNEMNANPNMVQNPGY